MKSKQYVLFVLVYVDDILVTGSDSKVLKSFIRDLDTHFALKTLGSMNYFLEFEVHRDSTGIYLAQSKYIIDLLKKDAMQDCKPCSTPVNLGVFLTDDGELFFYPSLYRTIIGSLQYLTYTIPDIAFMVNKLSQFLSSPKQQHWLACKRLLRYLKGTVGLGLLFTPSPDDLSLTVYTDVNHAGCKVTRKSTSGLCVFLGKNLLIWSSRKQSMVARSIGEAKYRAIAQGFTKILWLKSLFSELGYPCSKVPIIWSDNMATMSIAENLVFHSRTKDIKIDVYFVHEKVENSEVEIRYVPTLYQIVDIFTKDKLQLKTSSSMESDLRGNVEEK
ncbi:uncharacterized mitochondrial protein AtMg00810-like [Diospyros lotus]|uniref:uncharacterized mitochondrial protein AtMg00810-like n=1 Tax=Diospyros lotus TaxID=55363 RepID=UPI00224E9816|nr:uncharacterized mitochondrial protein AtMg00810-like [Diospyros lotus]